MGFVSRPALAVLSCCLVFGVLLGLTGLAKDSRLTEPSTATAGLRGVDEQETVSERCRLQGEVILPQQLCSDCSRWHRIDD